MYYFTMDGQDGNADDGRSPSFWKKNTSVVPGRPSPRKDNRSGNISTSTPCSYQDFQQSVSDAWDLGDDEFCNISTFHISKRVSQSAANSIINIHKTKTLHVYKNLDRKFQPERVKTIHGDMNNLSEEEKFTAGKLKISSQLNLYYSSIDLDVSKIKKFKNLLEAPGVLALHDLQNLSWPGIPFAVRADTWRLLTRYSPIQQAKRHEVLLEKREEYWMSVKQYYNTKMIDGTYQGTYRQIHIDIPRMSPTIGLLRQKIVQEMFERILFIYAVTHPQSGYVQGINDLVTPFYIVFLHELAPADTDIDLIDVNTLGEKERSKLEADSYWCFCNFLDGIQDNYIFPQAGIQQKINQLEELIQRIDGNLHRHLQRNGIEYLQFSFRWMNNLLTRELPLRCLIRLWDTYLAEIDTFDRFQLFVCAAFLLHWKKSLFMEKDFQGLMLMLQNLPTQNWDDSQIGMLVAEAHKLKYSFGDAPSHYLSKFI